MQIDIIAKGAQIVEVNQTQVIAFGNESNEISFPIVIKSGNTEKMYTVHAMIKMEHGKPQIKTRLE